MTDTPTPLYSFLSPEARVYVGDCRQVLPRVPEVKAGEVDLVFADPPFNWNRAYDQWDDKLPREDYLKFTAEWLDVCIAALKPTGSLWVNIPDDTCAEIVMHLKGRGLSMVNWCVWHYRFGQNRTERFINSKVHALYFTKDPSKRTWNPDAVLEMSDRAAIYNDPRTQSKRDGMPAGMRVPMDVWYGPYWGRIQGNNEERRANHDNQLPEVYLERVILSTSNPGDLVVDPFLGSGTTGVVARALGRRFIGSEFSEANAVSCRERFEIGALRVGKSRGQSTAIFDKRGGASGAPAMGGQWRLIADQAGAAEIKPAPTLKRRRNGKVVESESPMSAAEARDRAAKRGGKRSVKA